MDIIEHLGIYGGVAKRSEVTRTAGDRAAVDDGLADGSLRDLGGGWLAASGAEPAVVAARRFGGSITCVSAAQLYGLPTLTEARVPHVAVLRTRGVRRCREPAVLHRESVWSSPSRFGLPLAPPVEVVARVLRCLPVTDAVVVTDSALQQRLVSASDVDRLLVGPGSPAARAALDRCDGKSRSAIETLARLALQDAGLCVEPGVVIDGVGEVDLLVEGVVVVECDGFAYHSGRSEYREDRRRDRTLVARGFTVLRFTWEDIVNDPQSVVHGVLRVLLGHGQLATTCLRISVGRPGPRRVVAVSRTL